MRLNATSFLFATCISEALLIDIADDEIKRQLIRHNRQAKKRKEGDVLSTTINYYFHDGLSRSANVLFLRVALAWEKDTCVKFKLNRTATSVLVRADNGRECSYTDSLPEAKMMYISCGYFGGVAHEVGHALGLEHTHTRHDRDDYLIVNWTNVKKEFKEMAQKVPDLKLEAYELQYKNMTKEENENYDVPYDYGRSWKFFLRRNKFLALLCSIPEDDGRNRILKEIA
ncbi:hypothetical protein Y032_0010g880 [Ancylostoma ceylanicum]|nr:hypothetical protein Y032_0010g880 [Ancylostoma ceylanicum]